MAEKRKRRSRQDRADFLLCLTDRLRLQLQSGEAIDGNSLTISQGDIIRFGEATLDTQWIHCDPVRAKAESPFRGAIAHGFLLLSYIPYLVDLLDGKKYPEANLVVNKGLRGASFLKPVKAGSIISATSKVVSVEPSGKGLEILEEVVIRSGSNDEISCIVTVELLLIP